MNASTQPGRLAAGAVDDVPVPIFELLQAAIAWACVVPLVNAPEHFGVAVVLNLKSLSNSRVTVFANPPWALSPGWVKVVWV